MLATLSDSYYTWENHCPLDVMCLRRTIVGARCLHGDENLCCLPSLIHTTPERIIVHEMWTNDRHTLTHWQPPMTCNSLLVEGCVCVCLCVLAVSLRSKTHLSSGWREIWGVGCVLWKCVWARDWKHSGRVQISPRRQREAREEGNRQNDMILLIHPIHPLDLFDPWEMCKHLPE